MTYYIKTEDFIQWVLGDCVMGKSTHLIKPITKDEDGAKWQCVKCGERLTFKRHNVSLDSPMGELWKLRQAQGKPQ